MCRQRRRRDASRGDLASLIQVAVIGSLTDAKKSGRDLRSLRLLSKCAHLLSGSHTATDAHRWASSCGGDARDAVFDYGRSNSRGPEGSAKFGAGTTCSKTATSCVSNVPISRPPLQLTSAGQTFVFPYALHDKRIIEGARGCGGGGITVGVEAQIGALPLRSTPPGEVRGCHCS